MHFEYTKFWDKDDEIFQNVQNMTALRRRFKQNITTVGGKGKVAEQHKSRRGACQEKTRGGT